MNPARISTHLCEADHAGFLTEGFVIMTVSSAEICPPAFSAEAPVLFNVLRK